MTNLGWLDVSDISFNALLLLEPFHVAFISEWEPSEDMGTVLSAHPAIVWYLNQIHPPVKPFIEACLRLSKPHPTPAALREAEISILNRMQDWLIYILDPARYDRLEFLKWEDSSLLNMADFREKIVVDVGSGTGRLAFTVAPFARSVFALEPVPNLRRFIYQKRQALDLDNVFPIDGLITCIPLPSNFADILIAGHVFGDSPEEEYNEMRRVTRDGGMILLHPGTNAESENEAHQFLIKMEFAFDTFEEPGDGFKRKYWKVINKTRQK